MRQHDKIAYLIVEYFFAQDRINVSDSINDQIIALRRLQKQTQNDDATIFDFSFRSRLSHDP